MDAPACDAVVPVAAAAHLRPLMTGPPRSGKVLTSGRLAAYVRVHVHGVEDGAENGSAAAASTQVVSVVAPGAVVPATALVLPAGRAPDVLLPVGRCLVVGAGAVRSGRLMLRPARWFSAPRVVPGIPSADAVRLLAARLACIPAPPAAVVEARSGAAAAARALADDRCDEAIRLLASRLGLGPGATPSGDDVAAGVLLAARAVLPPGARTSDLEAVAGAVAELATVRTTAASAALLADAAAGWCAEPVARALAVLAPPATCASADRRQTGRRQTERAVDRLLALGHHSGADLATGVLAVLTTAPIAAERPPVPRPLVVYGVIPARMTPIRDQKTQV